MKDLRENKDCHHVSIENALPVAADILKNFSLQKKYTMRSSSVGHGYAGIQKFSTLI